MVTVNDYLASVTAVDGKGVQFLGLGKDFIIHDLTMQQEKGLFM